MSIQFETALKLPSKKTAPITSSDFFESILDALVEHIAVINSEGKIEWVNQAWLSFSDQNGGDRQKTSTGANYLTICDGPRQPADPDRLMIYDGIRRVIDNRESAFSYEYPCHSVDEKRWFIMRMKPLNWGEMQKYVISHQTITARKQIEDALMRSNESLKHFAFAVSHDLQQPLNHISGSLGALEATAGDRLGLADREYIDIATSGVHRMSRMIRDLLEYSCIENRAISKDEVHLSQVLQDAIDDFSAQIAETGAHLVYPPDLPVVRGTASLIYQIFENLISNALKYRAGGVAPEIAISCQRQDQNWLISIKDNGIGIDPAHLDTIFTIFNRATAGGSYEGSGIGLAVVKRMVEHMGGQIRVESQPGMGSTFHFTLPVTDI